jgi:hypothetical protein
MGIFIGGDTQSLEYDFGLKVAGSVAECPMKLYRNNIDVISPPVPTDSSWIEVTDQKTLDKLKAQNEIPLTSVDTTNRTAVWNGKNLVLQTDSQPSVRDDFIGKVSGSVTENPNIIKHNYNQSDTTLKKPSDFNQEGTSVYSPISSLNGNNSSLSAITVNVIPQQLFSFNLIRMLEDKYGSLPCPNDTVSKVAWLKQNINKITANWYGYGVNPLGNKAYLNVFRIDNNSWSSYPSTNTNSSASNIQIGVGSNSSGVANRTDTNLDSNGFVHFIAYTDAARTTDSALLVLTGHGLSSGDIIENTTRNAMGLATTNTINTNVLTINTTITGQISGDSIDKYHYSVNKVAEAGTTETVIKITNHGLSSDHAHYIKNVSRSWTYAKVVVTDANTLTIVSGVNYSYNSITGQTSGDTFYLYSYVGTQTAEGATNSTFLGLNAHGLNTWDFIENTTKNTIDIIKTIVNSNAIMLNVGITNQAVGDSINKYHYIGAKTAETGTTNTVIKITNHGLTIGSNVCIKNATRSFLQAKVVVTDANTLTIVSGTINVLTSITGQTSGDSIQLYTLVGTQLANDIVIPSTIFTDYISLDVKLKPTVGYDLLVPSNPRRDSVTGGNYDNIVMVEKVYNQVIGDFAGKVAGSVTENPNIFMRCTTNSCPTSLQIPSEFYYEAQQVDYNNVSTLNGVSVGGIGFGNTNVNGQIPQQLFQFNLVAIFEKQYGAIPAIDKVSWLKANISNIQCDWYGYGTCPSGNSAHIRAFNQPNGTWNGSSLNNTSNSPTNIVVIVSDMSYMDSNGMFSVLAYTDASDGITNSTIYTDYIKLTLNFSNSNNTIEYFTNNSVDIAVQTTSKASAYLVECDLTPIANALYGSSNSALKSALKAIQADVWASGYGANSNDLNNGIKVFVYGNGSFVELVTLLNSSAIISKKTWLNNTVTAPNYINISNKVYILITSANNSTVDVPSVVNLDYLNLKIDLTRVPDMISNPPTVNMTDTWSILVRGFSPAWDSSNSKIKLIMNLYKDDNNRCTLQFTNPTTLDITKRINGAWLGSLSTTTLSLNKFQISNILLNVDAINITLYILYNNNVMQKKQFSNTGFINGTTKLYPLQEYDGIYQADAFLDSIIYMPNQVWDDIQAEAILRGTKEGFEFPELFDINAVTLHANATKSNGTITLNATDAWQFSYEYINVLPNNQYQFKYSSTNNGYMVIEEYYNNVLLKSISFNNLDTGSFITQSNTNRIKVRTSNGGAGVFTFSNISLKLKM